MSDNPRMLYSISLFAPTRLLAHHVDGEGQYSILLFFTGSGQCRLEPPRLFEAGDAVLLRPGCSVDLVCDESGGASVVIIQIPQHMVPGTTAEKPMSVWIRNYFDAAQPDVWTHLAPRPLAELNDIFRALYTEYCAAKPGSAALTRQLLEVLTGWLAREHHAQHPSDPGEEPKLRGIEIVEQARRIITQEFTEPLTLNDAAKRCFVTPVYLSKLFREKTGLTFNRYLNLVRVSTACRLLLDTDELAVDIGEASGFGSTPHFNLTFRKLTGFTPLEYRRRFKYRVDPLRSGSAESEILSQK